MKINLSPDEFADFCILFFLDCMSNKDMMVKTSNKKFDLISNKLTSSGFKSIFMSYFFGVNPQLRQRYRNMRDIFVKKSSDQHYLYITQDKQYLDKVKKKGKDKEDIKPIATIKKAIKMATNLVVQTIASVAGLNSNTQLNPKKLEMIQEQIIKILEKDGDI